MTGFRNRPLSPAMRRASYAMIPVGLLGLPVGLYECFHGDVGVGLAAAIVGPAAATLAVMKLRVAR